LRDFRRATILQFPTNKNHYCGNGGSQKFLDENEKRRERKILMALA
jgi:hypothetical protein